MFAVRMNGGSAAAGSAFLAAMLLSSGCATCEKCGHTDSASTTQVQFYGPVGSRIVLHDVARPTADVWSSGPLGDRLEHEIEDYAVFDLAPGRYAFAYLGAIGAEDSAIYGELELRRPTSPASKQFVKHTFVPIRLLSAEHQEAEHLFPTRDISYTEGLESRQFDHLKQGDLMEQVYFVADLERTQKEYEVCYFQSINDIDRKLTVLADRAEYLDVRYSESRRQAMMRNPEMNIEDKIAHERYDVWGIEEPFVKVSAKRQAVERERESLLLQRRRLEDERGRREALLRSIQIVHRAGALVLATPDLKLPFHDSVQQASQLGDVLAVVRVGGRHQYWAWGRDATDIEHGADMAAVESNESGGATNAQR